MHCHLRTTKPQPRVTCKENFVKFGHVVFEIWKLTDRQTDMKITILCTPSTGQVINYSWPKFTEIRHNCWQTQWHYVPHAGNNHIYAEWTNDQSHATHADSRTLATRYLVGRASLQVHTNATNTTIITIMTASYSRWLNDRPTDISSRLAKSGRWKIVWSEFEMTVIR